MRQIHATAIVETQAKLGEAVTIGPYCTVGPEVELGDGVVLHSHAVIAGRTCIGARTQVYPFASIGHRPQDLKYAGEPSELIIGEDNQIREHVTINPGTTGGGMVTRVGNRCLLMVGAHVAHDCQLGNGVILANNATLAGHVTVDDNAIIGGLSAVQQFVRIGRNAMIGGMSGVEHDVIPFGLVQGDRARLNGLNIIGLKRHGYSRDQIQLLQEAYRLLFAPERTLAERLDEARGRFAASDPAGELIAFADADSRRALCQPKPEHGS